MISTCFVYDNIFNSHRDMRHRGLYMYMGLQFQLSARKILSNVPKNGGERVRGELKNKEIVGRYIPKIMKGR